MPPLVDDFSEGYPKVAAILASDRNFTVLEKVWLRTPAGAVTFARRAARITK